MLLSWVSVAKFMRIISEAVNENWSQSEEKSSLIQSLVLGFDGCCTGKQVIIELFY